MLVPITGVACKLLYYLDGFPGALRHPWIEEDVLHALRIADRQVRTETNEMGQLLVWDALRTMKTQQYLFEQELRRLSDANPTMSPEELQRAVEVFVRPPKPDLPPPHTTGGAVDVTILYAGSSVTLGKFDDFTPYGSAIYFQEHAPNSEEQALAMRLRKILSLAMASAGFVGIDTEWWHFECGTRYWSALTGSSVLFDLIQSPPEAGDIAMWAPFAPLRQPVIATGVAQVFSSPEDRDASLRGLKSGSYYARTRHSTERQLAAVLCAELGGLDVVGVQSGHAAALIAIWSLLPAGGTLLLDNQSYYETEAAIHELGADKGWIVLKADLTDPSAVNLNQKIDVIYCDHPRNWLLTCPDLASLRYLADNHGARLIVDISVQPLQRLDGVADLVVISLSKYPSCGLTLGGAIGAFSPDTLAVLRKTATALGAALAPEAAAKILEHTHSLRERLTAVSTKAAAVRDLLSQCTGVRQIYYPDRQKTAGLGGGQISFRLTAAAAERAEKIVAINALDPSFALSLACTFGSIMTTFEHFHARGNVPPAHLGGDIIRLGIGLEPTPKILSSLSLVLTCALE